MDRHFFANSLLPFGKKYKLKRLHEIPADYLLIIANDKGLMAKHYDVRRYIESNMDLLTKEVEQGFYEPERSANAIKLEPPKCTKIAYPTESEAKKHLRWIKEKSQGGHIKPYRAYECPDCSAWHLTSKEDIFWLKKSEQTQ
jgi:hypothetical protein